MAVLPQALTNAEYQLEMPPAALNLLRKISIGGGAREACALITGILASRALVVDRIVGVRNIRRLRRTFGVARRDVQALGTDLIGLFHSHDRMCAPSVQDLALFERCSSLKFQLIGVLDRDFFDCRAFDANSRELVIQWH